MPRTTADPDPVVTPGYFLTPETAPAYAAWCSHHGLPMLTPDQREAARTMLDTGLPLSYVWNQYPVPPPPAADSPDLTESAAAYELFAAQEFYAGDERMGRYYLGLARRRRPAVPVYRRRPPALVRTS